MADKKDKKKKKLKEIFSIFKRHVTKQATKFWNLLILPEHMEEDQKIQRRGSKELFLPKNDFKTFSVVKFPKKHPNFGGLETNQKQEIQT